MPITVICPNCRESLEIPNDLVGGDVRCGSCREVFEATPPPGTEVPPPLPREDRPRRPRRPGTDVTRNKPLPSSRPDDDYGPVEFDPDRKRKQGIGATVWILLGVFGLFGCACCGVVGYFMVQVAAPDYKEFKAPDGRFVAEFPAEVKAKRRDTGRGDEKVDSFEADRPLLQETYFVYAVELNPGQKEPAVALESVRKGLLKANAGAKELSQFKRTHQGFESMDVKVQLPGKRRFIQARIIATEDRAYVLGVAMQDEPEGKIWLDHFFESFEILPIEVKKDDKKPAKKDEKKAPNKDDDDDN